MLVTLQQLKDYLKITSNTSDSLLTSTIEQASSFIESYVGRKLELQDYTIRIDGNGQNELLLPQFPATLTSLSYNSGTIGTPVWTPISTDSYYGDAETGIVSLTFSLNRGIKNIQVIYEAGYDPIPDDIQRVCLSVASNYYKGAGKTTDAIKKEQVDGASIEYDTTIQTLEPEVFTVLNRYKKYV